MCTVISTQNREAAKEHICWLCGLKIHKKTVYKHSVFVYDNEIQDSRVHLKCEAIARELDMGAYSDNGLLTGDDYRVHIEEEFFLLQKDIDSKEKYPTFDYMLDFVIKHYNK